LDKHHPTGRSTPSLSLRPPLDCQNVATFQAVHVGTPLPAKKLSPWFLWFVLLLAVLVVVVLVNLPFIVNLVAPTGSETQGCAAGQLPVGAASPKEK